MRVRIIQLHMWASRENRRSDHDHSEVGDMMRSWFPNKISKFIKRVNRLGNIQSVAACFSERLAESCRYILIRK